MYNAIKGIPFEAKREIVIPTGGRKVTVDKYKGSHSERTSVGKSKTSRAQTYTFSNDKYDVTLIDTPGLGDTDGVEQDIKNAQEIIKGLSPFASFNAICILIKMSENRLTPYFLYYIKEFQKMLTQNVKDNIIICLSHGIGKEDEILKVIRAADIPTDHHIKFENSWLYANSFDEDGELQKILQIHSTKNFDKLLQMAATMELVETEEIKNLSVTRRELNALLEQMSVKLENIHNEKQTLLLLAVQLKSAEDQAGLNEAYSATKTKTERKQVETTHKNTSCTKCQVICHPECELKDTGGILGHEKLKACAAINEANCTECPLKCSYTYHRHVNWIWKDEVVEYKEIDEAMRNAYKHSTEIAEQKAFAISTVKLKIDRLNEEADKAGQQIASLYLKIEQLALTPFNTSFNDYLDYLDNNNDNNPKLTLDQKKERKEQHRKMRQLYDKQKQLIETSLKYNKKL